MVKILDKECRLRYNQGQLFENEYCNECFCLGKNNYQCVAKECPECESSQYYQINHNCNCICKNCNHGEKFCPSSKMCLEEKFWCDGIDHCSDDEKDCPVTTTTTTQKPSDQRFSFSGQLCPPPQCNPGLKPVETEVETLDGCPYYKCISQQITTPPPSCPKPICPPGYVPKLIRKTAMKLVLNSDSLSNRTKRYAILEDQLNCPEYECIREDSNELFGSCKYEGNTLTTFDEMEMKRDLCHHSLLETILDNFKVECKFIFHCVIISTFILFYFLRSLQMYQWQALQEVSYTTG